MTVYCLEVLCCIKIYFLVGTLSSVGQSTRLITDRSRVQVPEGPLHPIISDMASWLSWLERRPVTAEVEGSSPSGVVNFTRRRGGIGRRPGLKIPWVVIPVPVRPRSPA